MSEQHANSAFKIGLNLALACIISGMVIAATYYVTNPVAEAEAIKLRNKAMQDIVPQASSFKAIKGHEGWFKAKQDGKTIAYIVPSENSGYGGAIKMIVGLTPEGKVITYKILKHNETPGLGDKANKPQFIKQFAGKDYEELKVVKVSTQKNIQALTGATVTSIAVTNAVRYAIEDLEDYLDGKPTDAVSQATAKDYTDATSKATGKPNKTPKTDSVTKATKKEKAK